MKSILETSMYLIVMVIITLISIDFITINISVSKANEKEQYIENIIEIYGKSEENHQIDNQTIEKVKAELGGNDTVFHYEYVDSTKNYDYYKIALQYGITSRVFKINKNHTFNGIVRVGRTDLGGTS